MALVLVPIPVLIVLLRNEVVEAYVACVKALNTALTKARREAEAADDSKSVQLAHLVEDRVDRKVDHIFVSYLLDVLLDGSAYYALDGISAPFGVTPASSSFWRLGVMRSALP